MIIPQSQQLPLFPQRFYFAFIILYIIDRMALMKVFYGYIHMSIAVEHGALGKPVEAIIYNYFICCNSINLALTAKFIRIMFGQISAFSCAANAAKKRNYKKGNSDYYDRMFYLLKKQWLSSFAFVYVTWIL
jgi:hypothetical protein